MLDRGVYSMYHETIEECLNEAFVTMQKTPRLVRNSDYFEPYKGLTNWQIIKQNLFEMYRGYSPHWEDETNKSYRIFFNETGLEIETTTGLKKCYSLQEIRDMYEQPMEQLRLF